MYLLPVSLFTAIIFLISFTYPVSCIPKIAFPINSQFPPVGRVSQPFSFTFSEVTFISDIPPIYYEIRDGPSWLRLNGENRTLYGSPLQTDSGLVPLSLVARDNTGELVHRINLAISTDSSPRLERSVGEQLAGFGRLSPEGGLLLSQGQRFDFSFSPETFSDRERIKGYSAVSLNNTPLPAWLSFDPSTLSFSGTALSLDTQPSPPQTFGVKLLAEDILGFEGASAQFFLVVTHKLNTARRDFKFSAASGVDFAYAIPLENILLDDVPIPKSLIRNITAYAPDWIKLDYERLILAGRPLRPSQGQIVTILVEDIFANQVSISITIDVVSNTALFTKDFENLNLTKGEHFEYKFNSTFFNQPVDLSASFLPDIEWISFDQLTRVLKGQVPIDTENLAVKVNITAKNAIGQSQSQSFTILVEDETSSFRGTNITNLEFIEDQKVRSSRKRLRTILLATLIPMSILALAFIVLCCLTRRRFASFFENHNSPRERSGTPTCDMISRPIHNSISTQPWPVATLPGKNPNYTRVVERKYSPGPGFVGIGLPSVDPRREGVGALTRTHTKNFSVGSNLLMRMGDPSFGSGYSSNATISSLESVAGTPRRLASIPTLTRIVSGEPIGKNVSGESGTAESVESRNWEPASRGSDDSLNRSASARRSWRKTMMWGQRSGTRDSDASVDTVSTTEVFSVKLVGSPILLGDGKEAKQWQPKGLERVDESSRRSSHQDRNSGYDWDFGDTLGGIGWIPRPSPARYSAQSLQRGSEAFEDYGIAMGSPTIPNLPIGGYTMTGQSGSSTRMPETETPKGRKGEILGKNKAPELQAGGVPGIRYQNHHSYDFNSEGEIAYSLSTRCIDSEICQVSEEMAKIDTQGRMTQVPGLAVIAAISQSMRGDE
ncbi:hypothetical protein DFH27DRAFT_521251 [Peziza echinospora]|nr:hypothetical protein DFH27DRAFT_521251 [Peziza echinospora]